MAILALWKLCQGYHVRAQLFFSAIWSSKSSGSGCTSRYTSGTTPVYTSGTTSGYTSGTTSGYTSGTTSGYTSGTTSGYTTSTTSCYTSGTTSGTTHGYTSGGTSGCTSSPPSGWAYRITIILFYGLLPFVAMAFVKLAVWKTVHLYYFRAQTFHTNFSVLSVP